MKTVLISGAGIAGPTLAYWLARNGYRPTVVERSAGLRTSGNPVDVRGPAWPVASRMGLLPTLREFATQATGMRVVGTSVRLPMGGAEEIELSRTDLAAVLYDAARPDAEFVFDDTITGLSEDAGGVDVTFERGTPRRFDYVVGADGLHSTVRRLAFGPEERFVHHAGLYVATLPLAGEPAEPHDVMLYNQPRRLVALHPSRGTAGAAFIFRGPATDYRGLERQKKIVTTVYRDASWRVPELLKAVRDAEDLYFDAVSYVRLPRWSTHRITLVGDAASCVSLFGDGSSLAMAGAYTLAQTMNFAAYEREHRKLTTPKQRHAGLGAALLVPRTALGIALRNGAGRWVARLG